jgi:hypothetical protein
MKVRKEAIALQKRLFNLLVHAPALDLFVCTKPMA